MRRVCGALAALVLSGAIFTASAETSTADEKADVARVEQELRATAEAAAIYSQARERARKAVEMSSLGRELRRVEREWGKFEKGEEISEPASRLREKRIFYKKQIGIFVNKMTRIFLNDEIERAKQKKLDGLMRELKKIRKKD